MLQMISNYLFGMGLFLNTVLAIPQLILLFKRKRADNLSLLTFVGFCLIQLFIIFHGLYAHDSMLVIGYIFSLIGCASVTILIAYYKYREIIRHGYRNQNQ